MINPWRGLRGMPAEVWLVFAVTLVNRVGTMALPFLALYLVQHRGYSAGEAGALVAAYGVGGLVSAPLAGRLTDRIGALRVMRLSLVGAGILLILLPHARDPASLVAVIVLWAVVGEAVRPASLVALTEAVEPDRRKAAIALNRLAINLGMSLGPVAGGYLAVHSFPLLFTLDGITSLLAAGALTVAAARLRVPLTPRRPSRTAPADAGPAGPASVWRDTRTLAFLASMLLVSVVFFQFEAALPLFLVRDLGLSARFYGTVFLVNTALIVALEVPLNLAMARWSYRAASVLGALLVTLGFAVLALVTGPVGVALSVAVWTFGEMILFPVAASYVADRAPDARRGEYLGLYAMSFGSGFALGPLLGTQVMDALGARTLWWATLPWGLAASALMWLTFLPARPARQLTG